MSRQSKVVHARNYGNYAGNDVNKIVNVKKQKRVRGIIKIPWVLIEKGYNLPKKTQKNIIEARQKNSLRGIIVIMDNNEEVFFKMDRNKKNYHRFQKNHDEFILKNKNPKYPILFIKIEDKGKKVILTSRKRLKKGMPVESNNKNLGLIVDINHSTMYSTIALLNTDGTIHKINAHELELKPYEGTIPPPLLKHMMVNGG